MKLGKLEIKNLLKEAIKELIAEGAFDSVTINENNKPKNTAVHSNNNLNESQREEMRKMILGGPSFHSNSPSSSVVNNDENVKKIVSQTIQNISGDSKSKNMLENILMDTAMTTLVQQGENVPESLMNIPQPEDAKLKSLVENNDMSRWARLAFNKK